MEEAIGWASSFVLILTISAQLHKQWRSGTSEGVSPYLFIGQIVASLGFVLYSWLIGNWVFVATNGVLAIEAMLGLSMVAHHRRERRRSSRASLTAVAQRSGARMPHHG